MSSSHRRAAVFAELLAALVGIGLIGTLITGAYAAVRQRRQVDAASASLEEAQNLLARWRSGGAIAAPGWSSETSTAAPGVERLTLRAPGVKVSTLRRAGGAP